MEYLLDSVQASTMLSNSEFVVMLNQAASDREKLARLLNISSEQMTAPIFYIDKELQRISRESLAQIGEKGIMFKFPTVRGCNSTVRR